MKQTKSNAMLSVPQEIISNILSRLSTKSLGQCKCVCKSLHSLISDPEFAKLHLNRAISERNHLGLFTASPYYSLDVESEYAFEDVDGNEALVDLGIPSNVPTDIDVEVLGSVEFVGSCNGLICLFYTTNSFTLWNPTIKESREIPDSTTSLDDDDLLFYGIGYISSADDYILVTCVYSNNTNTLIVNVFSLKVGVWRSIEHDLKKICINTPPAPAVGIYQNDALHWDVIHGTDPDECIGFIFLDMAGENFKFGEILEPKIDDNGSIRFHTLGVLDGCLSLLSDQTYDELGIWVMKEYGVRESWTRIAILNLNDFSYCNYLEPVCSAKNGEIIIDIDGEALVRYNMNEKTSRNLKNGGGPNYLFAQYVESLVSPNSYYAINQRN